MLANKNIIVTGVANAKSIAWNIAKKFHKEKANVIVTYQRPEFKNKIQGLIDNALQEEPNNCLLKSFCCDATNMSNLAALKDFANSELSTITSLLHSIAFAPSTALKNPLLSVSNEDFNTTMSISVYSLISLTNTLLPLFSDKASIASLSFIGSERYIPNYGVMSIAKAALESTSLQLAGCLGEKGVRVNVLRSSPVNTLAARGIPQFVEMKNAYMERQPLKQESVIDDVVKNAVWLMSDYSEGVTGQVINVDGGYSILCNVCYIKQDKIQMKSTIV